MRIEYLPKLFVLLVVLPAAFAIFWTQNHASESLQSFEDRFQYLYGFSADDFISLGDSDIQGRWLDAGIVAKMDCERFDSCNFVEIATIESCGSGFTLEYELFDESEKLMKTLRVDAPPITAGEIVIVEIGADTSDDFGYLLPTVAQCNSSPVPL
jgi:hypothetical protein